MSHVSDTILLLGGLLDYDDQRPWLDRINTWIAEQGCGRGLVSVDDPALPAAWYGGSKALQAGVAVGAFNYLDVDDFLAFLCSLPWDSDDVWYVQVVIQDEHDDEFTMHKVYTRASDKPSSGLTVMAPSLEDFGTWCRERAIDRAALAKVGYVLRLEARPGGSLTGSLVVEHPDGRMLRYRSIAELGAFVDGWVWGEEDRP